jgi:hypothetical protein
VLLLGAVPGLNAEDKEAVSAVTGSLEKQFSIGRTEIGVLVSVFLGIFTGYTTYALSRPSFFNSINH